MPTAQIHEILAENECSPGKHGEEYELLVEQEVASEHYAAVVYLLKHRDFDIQRWLVVIDFQNRTIEIHNRIFECVPFGSWGPMKISIFTEIGEKIFISYYVNGQPRGGTFTAKTEMDTILVPRKYLRLIRVRES